MKISSFTAEKMVFKYLPIMREKKGKAVEIRVFSNEVSRLPRPINVTRDKIISSEERNSQNCTVNHQEFRVSVDDEWRPNSCDRDAASEIISMYEKMNYKPFNSSIDDSEVSSILIQTLDSLSSCSYNSNNTNSGDRPVLKANHQRHQSFPANSAGFKRSRARLSSPALTDEDHADYSWRTEIERVPNVSSKIIINKIMFNY